MTWIRVDTNLPTEPVIGELCERLNVDIPTAVGLYICTLLGFADHKSDAMVDQVRDVSLEQWSYWGTVKIALAMEPRLYATTFRELCVQREAEKRDPVGRLKGWWRQEALIRKQIADAQRRRSGGGGGSDPGGDDGGSPASPPSGPRGFRAGSEGNVDGNVDGNGVPTTTSGKELGETVDAGRPVDALAYVIRVVGAANRGLRENPAYTRDRSFNELTCSNQDAHIDWIHLGIPVDVAEQAVYQRGLRFRPSRNRPQPTTLNYFTRGVEEDWEKAQAREAGARLKTGRGSAPGSAAALPPKVAPKPEPPPTRCDECSEHRAWHRIAVLGRPMVVHIIRHLTSCAQQNREMEWMDIAARPGALAIDADAWTAVGVKWTPSERKPPAEPEAPAKPTRRRREQHA